MKCIECKWYSGQVNDQYGVCKRYPQIANKSQHDWCGEFTTKVETAVFESTEYNIATDEIKPKYGRRAKNAD
jgi:hypothetical protein